MRRAATRLTGLPLRVLVLNVHTESSGFAEVRRLIADAQPDVVGLVEVDERWLAAWRPRCRLSGRLERRAADNFGVALYSRAAARRRDRELGSWLPTRRRHVVRGRRFVASC